MHDPVVHISGLACSYTWLVYISGLACSYTWLVLKPIKIFVIINNSIIHNNVGIQICYNYQIEKGKHRELVESERDNTYIIYGNRDTTGVSEKNLDTYK